MKACLIDSGFLYALIDETDRYHEVVRSAADSIFDPILLPTPAITETAYFVQRNLGQTALVEFVERLGKIDVSLIEPEASDFRLAADVLNRYLDQDIDFVDALIVALAERLNITRILTVDRRHFGIFRPSHCDAFEILP